jgi:hypothetical protein
MKKYYKLTNELEIHNGVQYYDGLNVDILPFAENGSCCKGGLYFSDETNILQFLDGMFWIREITIPDGEMIVKDPCINPPIWRSHSVVCGSRKSLTDFSTWVWMFEEGIQTDPNDALRWSAENGHLECLRMECLRLILEKFSNFETYSINYALRWCAEKGQLIWLRMILEKFSTFENGSINYALRLSAEKGHFKCLQMILEKFSNFENGSINYALFWSAKKEHVECNNLIKYHFDK